jgi:hypothetical protein
LVERKQPLVISIALACIALAHHTSSADPPDPAARGLDAFMHLPAKAPPHALVPVQIETIGFPTAIAARPLGGAEVEVVWNPEKLGPGVAVAPPPVKATTDAACARTSTYPCPTATSAISSSS